MAIDTRPKTRRGSGAPQINPRAFIPPVLKPEGVVDPVKADRFAYSEQHGGAAKFGTSEYDRTKAAADQKANDPSNQIQAAWGGDWAKNNPAVPQISAYPAPTIPSTPQAAGQYDTPPTPAPATTAPYYSWDAGYPTAGPSGRDPGVITRISQGPTMLQNSSSMGRTGNSFVSPYGTGSVSNMPIGSPHYAGDGTPPEHVSSPQQAGQYDGLAAQPVTPTDKPASPLDPAGKISGVDPIGAPGAMNNEFASLPLNAGVNVPEHAPLYTAGAGSQPVPEDPEVARQRRVSQRLFVSPYPQSPAPGVAQQAGQAVGRGLSKFRQGVYDNAVEPNIYGLGQTAKAGWNFAKGLINPY